jgi:hypothetical protein
MTTDSASVYYVEALPDDGAELKSIALDGSASKTLVSGHFFPPTLGTAWPSWVIGADAASVYWTGSDVEMDPVTGLGKYDGIFKSPIEGGAATRLTPALYNNLVYLAPAFFSHPNPGDQDLYAVDRDTVYWAQSQGGGGFVGTLSVNGGDPVNLDSNLSPGPYALIIDDDFVYYVADSLKKMPKGGGTPKSLGGLGYTELALDATHLYSFGGGNTIYRLSKNGGAVETVATGQEMPACIAVDDERVYWVTYPLYPSTNNVTRSVIMTIPK